MPETNNQKPIKLLIESPLTIDGIEMSLSVARLELASDKNLMFHCENQEWGFALVRAILGLERISRGLIRIETEKYGTFINRKEDISFPGEKVRMAYVSEHGSDFCRDLTIKENLDLIEKNPDFNNRVQQLAADFLVEKSLDNFPDSVNTNQMKIFSIIRAWAYLPDIIVYSNPLEHLDELSNIEILQNFAVPRSESLWLSIVCVPSIGTLSNVLHNFHMVEIIH